MAFTLAVRWEMAGVTGTTWRIVTNGAGGGNAQTAGIAGIRQTAGTFSLVDAAPRTGGAAALEEGEMSTGEEGMAVVVADGLRSETPPQSTRRRKKSLKKVSW